MLTVYSKFKVEGQTGLTFIELFIADSALTRNVVFEQTATNFSLIKYIFNQN